MYNYSVINPCPPPQFQKGNLFPVMEGLNHRGRNGIEYASFPRNIRQTDFIMHLCPQEIIFVLSVRFI